MALAALFAGRLAFGLASEFWSEDETQIYLMGLRAYATGEWPYFGPDVVWTQSAIAGALQPLLVALPLYLAPVPEAPFVLLNVLSFTALGALAWYIGRREPSLPRWLVWGWLLTAPWTLQFSTHVNNPSYVLPAAVAFFIGFCEAVPALGARVLPPRAAFAAMGAAIAWIMQIHMSWPLLVPYAAVALYLTSVRHVVWLAAGAAVPLALLVPTYLRFGLQGGSGGALSNLDVHLVPPDRLVTTLAQVLSFASLEINRFVATDNAKRLAWLADHLWAAPFAAVVLAAGLAQPVWMLATAFRRRPGRSDWGPLRMLVGATVGLIYVSYCFATEEPQAHAFYAVAPLAFLYAAACWATVDSPRWRRVAAGVLACNIAFHAALAWTQGPRHSLYANRDVIAAAIERREPQVFAHRRPYAVGAGPRAIDARDRPHDTADLAIEAQSVRTRLGGAAVWTMVVVNRNPRVAFRSPIYVAEYVDGEGGVVRRHQDVITDVWQPGEAKEIRVADTVVAEPFARAAVRILAAEALLPARAP